MREPDNQSHPSHLSHPPITSKPYGIGSKEQPPIQLLPSISDVLPRRLGHKHPFSGYCHKFVLTSPLSALVPEASSPTTSRGGIRNTPLIMYPPLLFLGYRRPNSAYEALHRVVLLPLLPPAATCMHRVHLVSGPLIRLFPLPWRLCPSPGHSLLAFWTPFQSPLPETVLP